MSEATRRMAADMRAAEALPSQPVAAAPVAENATANDPCPGCGKTLLGTQLIVKANGAKTAQLRCASCRWKGVERAATAEHAVTALPAVVWWNENDAHPVFNSTNGADLILRKDVLRILAQQAEAAPAPTAEPVARVTWCRHNHENGAVFLTADDIPAGTLLYAAPVGHSAATDEPTCWSCKQPYTLEQRADADGNCPHCGVEIELAAPPTASGGGADSANAGDAEVSDKEIRDTLGTWGTLPPKDGAPARIIEGREQLLIASIRDILSKAYAATRLRDVRGLALEGIKAIDAAHSPVGGGADLSDEAISEIADRHDLKNDIRPMSYDAEIAFARDIIDAALAAVRPAPTDAQTEQLAGAVWNGPNTASQVDPRMARPHIPTPKD